jgi:hypothetical protein
MKTNVLNSAFWILIRIILLVSIVLAILKLNTARSKTPDEELYTIFRIVFSIGIFMFTFQKWITWVISLIFIIPSLIYYIQELFNELITGKIEEKTIMISIYVCTSAFILFKVLKYLSSLKLLDKS